MASKKIQLYTDRANTIEASPETSANCVILSDGNDLQKVLDNDLTNPTVVHEETSFKVGVGDIDVSSSVVDGEVGRMVIKGKTYQNILPEPSTHVLTSNKEMFKVNEGLDPNVEIVDAVSKSAILKGQTLVNLLNDDNIEERKASNGSAICGFDKETLTFHFITNLNHPYNQSYVSTYNGDKSGVAKYLKNNTDYTIMWYGEKIKDDDDSKTFIRVGASENNYGNPSVFTNEANIKTGKILYRTQTSYADNIVRLLGIKIVNVSNDIEYKLRFVILEGDYTNVDIPYFEGIQSVRMPVLKTLNNIVDFSNEKLEFEYGVYFGQKSDGSDWVNNKGIASSFVYTLNYIELLPIQTRLSTYGNDTIVDRVVWFDENKNQLGSVVSVNNRTLSIPTGAKYFRFLLNNSRFTEDKELAKDNIGHYNFYYGGENQIFNNEPHKSNILHTPEEVVLRSLPNGAKDTLNLNTGEYVQRIKEVTFDGSNDEGWAVSSQTNSTTQCFDISVAGASSNNDGYIATFCDKFPSYTASHLWSYEKEGVGNPSSRIRLRLNATRLSTVDVAGLRTYLQSNPITVQYELATPIVKTVDLSTSGNWEKVVLDGSENWTRSMTNNNYFMETNISILPNRVPNAENYFIHDSSLETTKVYTSNTNIGICVPSNGGIRIRTIEVQKGQALEEFKQCLQQNPITVWYQTTTHKDSTQVKQPIFFKDGHIQLSSGADNSLIPTLDYQAKTSNSYVMDLMKSNTQYTMKAKTASGTFTIDGASYNAGTNGTFTSPSSMTNKLLVMSNKTNTEVMILEGDLTSKTIPYFKGIKSAFEGEDKIEVLSTGKNLFDGELFKGYFYGNIGSVHTIKTSENAYYTNTQKVKPNAQYLISFIGKTEKNFIYCRQLDKNGVTLNETSQNFANGYMGVNTVDNCCSLVLCTHANYEFAEPPLFQIEESSSSISTAYEPYKSNSTKIPLLSPLRSLPNGGCDELIIDRMKKKATLIQRIDKIVFDGKQRWLLWDNNPADVVSGYVYYDANNMGYEPKSFGYTINDRLPHNSGGHIAKVEGARYTNYFTASLHKSRIGVVSVNDTTANTHMVQRWYTENPMTMYYELATPIITEIDLENFPLVYKDGHIFLNSEIAPVVEINYNINQSQQIQSNNETLQRHELDILDLDNLIVSFVNAEYSLRLLKFNMELSMMALAE